MTAARDLWWLWLSLALLGWGLGLALAQAWAAYSRTSQHLMNAYRLELGEAPLWPDHRCPMCNPEDAQ